MEFHRVRLERRRVENVKLLRKFAVAESRAEEISGSEERFPRAVARIFREALVIADDAPGLPAFEVAAEAGARRHADKSIESDTAFEEHVEYAGGEKAAHRAAFQYKSSSMVVRVHKNGKIIPFWWHVTTFFGFGIMPAMKTTGIFLMVAFASMTAMAERFAGFWTTVDDESREKKSVVQVYVYEGKYYGRIVKLFKNQDAVAKLPGSPKICGLDIIWDMKKDGDTLDGGKILDPKKGKVYSCEMWRKGENLIVRGKIAFIGRNQTWLPYKDEDLSKEAKPLVPALPRL